MPKYYCDYCDIVLTHDSPSVRKSHNFGWKHRMHVQNYYAALGQDKIQEIIDTLVNSYSEYLSQMSPYAQSGFSPLETPQLLMQNLSDRMLRQGYPMPQLVPIGGMPPPPIDSSMAKVPFNRYPYLQASMLPSQAAGIPPQPQQMQFNSPMMVPPMSIPPIQLRGVNLPMYLQPPGPPPSLPQIQPFPPASQP